MTYAEFAENIKNLAESLGCSYAYHHFPKGKVPELPWLVFDYPQGRSVFADDTNYATRTEWTLEFYCEVKDFATETAIGEALKSYGLTYEKYEDWVEDENYYRISFEGEVIING